MKARQGLAYGFLGLPLAFVALPLYIHLPQYYAQHFALPLASIGVLLLVIRLLDAVVDPLLGRWVDRLFHGGLVAVLRVSWWAAAALAVGFVLLWSPLVAAGLWLWVWLTGALVLTYFSFSLLSIVHQAWGARRAGNALERSLIVSWREGLGVCGVLLASVLPSGVGYPVMALVLAALLLAALLFLRQSAQQMRVFADNTAQELQPQQQLSQQPQSPASNHFAAAQHSAHTSPWSVPAFRWLLLVFLLNGIASAITATLLPFFVNDRLRVPSYLPVFLLGYFLAAVLSIPAWNYLIARLGLVRCWLLGMVLAVLGFFGVLALGAGNANGFLAICIATGVALGADLCVPAALLTGVVQRSGLGHHSEAQFFGWWACASKFNLALAAGVTLPLLQWLGYAVGSQESSALWSLALTYGLLPCILKLVAMVVLWRSETSLGEPTW